MKRLSLRIAFLVLGSVMAVDRVGYAQVASPPGISKLNALWDRCLNAAQ